MAYRCKYGRRWCDGCGECEEPEKCPKCGEDLDEDGACPYCGWGDLNEDDGDE